MKVIVSLIVGLAALAEFGFSDPLISKTPPGKELYQSLPIEERLEFLAFSLGDGFTKNETMLQRIAPFPFPDALGIDNKLVEKFKSLDVPQNFTTNLYVWIRTRYGLDSLKMAMLIVNRRVCLSNGDCIDIGDIGGLCCPF